MAKNGNGGSGDVVDRPGDEGATMEPEAEDRTTVEVTVGESAAIVGDGNGSGGRKHQVEGDGDGHAPEGEPYMPEQQRPAGFTVQSLDPSTEHGRGRLGDDWWQFEDAGGSGASGGDIRPSRSLPRDSVRGKGIVTEGKRPQRSPLSIRRTKQCFGLRRCHRVIGRSLRKTSRSF